jgi:hypothetical protein
MLGQTSLNHKDNYNMYFLIFGIYSLEKRHESGWGTTLEAGKDQCVWEINKIMKEINMTQIHIHIYDYRNETHYYV